MVLVVLLVAAVPQTGAASVNANGEPAIHMTADHFAQNVVLLPKGSKLLIVSDSSVEHILQNGAWNTSGIPQPLVEPGAPILLPHFIGFLHSLPFHSPGFAVRH
jgi:hypothetical protein